MWPQTAATPYILQPWNSAPLTGSPPEAIAAKPRAGKAFALVLPRICVPGVRSAQRFSFISAFLLPSAYPPRFYYRKRKHSFNNIPLHQAFFFHLPDGSPFLHQISAFLTMPHIRRDHFSALLSFICQVIPAGYQNETPTMGPEVNVDSRASGGLLW